MKIGRIRAGCLTYLPLLMNATADSIPSFAPDGAQNAWYWNVPVACAVMLGAVGLMDANCRLFLQLNGGAQWAGPVFWSCATVLGDALVAAVLVFPLIRRGPDMLWALLLATVVATVFTHGLKPLLDIERPAAVLGRELFTVIGPAHKHHAFPSGHTITAFAVAGVLALSTPRIGPRIVLLCGAALVGMSRIAVGVHWPMDVLGGAALGWIAAGVGVRLGARWKRPDGIWFQVCAGVLLSIACVVLATVHRTRYPDALWFQRGIAVVFLVWGVWEMRGIAPGIRRPVPTGAERM